MIETQRLVISEMSLRDIEEARALHNHPETLKWLSDTHEVTKDEQLQWFESLQSSSFSKRFISREKSDNTLIGVFRLDRLDKRNSSAEVGLDVSYQFRRKGFAREIYEALIPYFFNEISLHRLSLITLDNNLPAIQLYESLGFKREGILRDVLKRDTNFVNAIQFSLLESEFKI